MFTYLRWFWKLLAVKESQNVICRSTRHSASTLYKCTPALMDKWSLGFTSCLMDLTEYLSRSRSKNWAATYYRLDATPPLLKASNLRLGWPSTTFGSNFQSLTVLGKKELPYSRVWLVIDGQEFARVVWSVVGGNHWRQVMGGIDGDKVLLYLEHWRPVFSIQVTSNPFWSSC